MIVKSVAWTLAAALVAGIVLGIISLIWLAWSWAMPQLWPGGPPQLIAPGFWLFAVVWLLVGFVGRQIFGRGGKA